MVVHVWPIVLGLSSYPNFSVVLETLMVETPAPELDMNIPVVTSVEDMLATVTIVFVYNFIFTNDIIVLDKGLRVLSILAFSSVPRFTIF